MTSTTFQRLKKIAATSPNQIAVIEGESKFKYKNLFEDVLQQYATLKDLGVNPGDSIVVIMSPSYAYVVTAFSVLALGAKLAPMNPAFSADELAEYIKRTSSFFPMPPKS